MNQVRKPLIGLTPYYNIEKGEPYMRPAYLKAIEAVGGIPVILPIEAETKDLQQLVDTLDGFLFTGGPDVHPFYFGEEALAQCGNISSKRDILELSLLPPVMVEKKPILGICRGVQLLNVALGGDLYQDIPSQVSASFPLAHSQTFAYEIPSHHVAVAAGSLLEKVTGVSRLAVNSMHHQAVRSLAPGLMASGTSSDGLVEALEKPDYPYFLGVQWHPEYLWEEDEGAREIFASFVRACCQS